MAAARENQAISTDPRALYHRGLAESHRGEVHSLQTPAAAPEASTTRQDVHSAALAAAALLFTGHCLGNYRGLRERADARRPADGSLQFADPDDELVAYAGSLFALLMLCWCALGAMLDD